MDALLTSLTSVTLAEIGDKTQLLALFLATRFTSKTSIIFGILVATVVNHAASAWFGSWVTTQLPESWTHWLIGISFIAVACWLLIPDKDEGNDSALLKMGAFWATLLLFSLAEIGDKTQVATILLGANFTNTIAVIIGSTLGMLLANLPMIYAGHILLNSRFNKFNSNQTRRLAFAIFLTLGIITLLTPFF